MKKTKYIILMSSLILLSGCVKSNTTMTINKDKSMSLSSKVLISDKINNDNYKLLIKEEKDKLQKKNITIENINDSNGYSGFSVTKKYDNIDKVSSEEYKEVVISNFLTDDFDDSVLFQVKKGKFKNVYTANYKFEVEDTFDSAEESTFETNEDTTEVLEEVENIDDSNSISASDLLKLPSEMEFKYIVELPYKALESNSSSKSNDDKTLEWNLTNNSSILINYSFELYNMNNIYIAIGIFVGCILLVIFLIIIKNKVIQKRRDKLSRRPILKEYDPSIENELFKNNKNNVLNTVSNHIDNSSVNENVKGKDDDINNIPDSLEKTQIINIPDDVK